MSKPLVNVPAIRAEMFKRYMTQTELAEKTGLSQGTISHILAGKSGSLPSLRKVAKALDLDIGVIAIPAPTPT
jgi:transcriptional regulator with XRE-family HTH domain